MLSCFVRRSGNAKTGPIPTTMTEPRSCPGACSIRQCCYAACGLCQRDRRFVIAFRAHGFRVRAIDKRLHQLEGTQ